MAYLQSLIHLDEWSILQLIFDSVCFNKYFQKVLKSKQFKIHKYYNYSITVSQ